MKLGLLQPGENIQIEYRFDAATFRKIVQYDMAERKQQHTKELLQVDVMEKRELPMPPAEVVNKMRRGVKDVIARAAGVLERLCVNEDWFQDSRLVA